MGAATARSFGDLRVDSCDLYALYHGAEQQRVRDCALGRRVVRRHFWHRAQAWLARPLRPPLRRALSGIGVERPDALRFGSGGAAANGAMVRARGRCDVQPRRDVSPLAAVALPERDLALFRAV